MVKKLVLGSRVIVVRGKTSWNRSERRIFPHVKRGPFMTFVLSWRFGELEFGLKRWL